MRIPFGHDSVDIALEEGRPIQVVSPKPTPPSPEALEQTLTNPLDFKDFSSFVADKRRILVVVNDHTRSTPTAEVLRHLELKGKQVTTLIASGSHRPPSSEELRRIIGGESPPYGGKVAIHNCRDMNSLKLLGQTSRGTRVLVNSLLFEADGIIPVASVEPHYFAGFTGGRKFLLPALAGFDSIAANHSLAADDSARLLALDGNPVHEDFVEALRMFGRTEGIFSIQLVLNREAKISYASSGEITKSFTQAVRHAEEVYVANIRRKADIVVSVNEPPLDLDLYQSQKAIQNVEFAVKPGGIVILVSSCREGIGDQHFYKLATSEMNAEAGEYSEKFGYHKVARLRRLLSKTKIYAVTNLPSSIPKAIGLVPYQNVQDAIEDATTAKGDASEVLFVLNSGITVPLASEA